VPNTNLFRKEALEALNSPEQLDQLIQVVTPKAWIAANTCYAILFFLFLWSIFGSVPTKADSYGILLAGGGDIYSAVAPDGPSQVDRFLIKTGDAVKKGQPLVVLSRRDISDEIQTTQKYLIELQTKYRTLFTDSQHEIAIRQEQTVEQQASQQRAIDNAKIKAENLLSLLKVRESAFKKGLETRQNVVQTSAEYYSVQNEIENLSNQIIQAQVAQDNFVAQLVDELRTLAIKVADEQLKFTNLQTRLKLSSTVVSPISGVITHIPIAVGSIAETGLPLVSIASNGKGLDALVYLPPKLGKQVKVGMQAQVSPTTVEKAEFGSIYGKVVSVASFPATPEAILATLQNKDLVKKFTQKEPPIEVRIHLDNSDKTFSGLKWTSSKGPKQLITPGTLAAATITIRKQAPITLVIPALKKLLGVE
jgi:HlyD family secretion protein